MKTAILIVVGTVVALFVIGSFSGGGKSSPTPAAKPAERPAATKQTIAERLGVDPAAKADRQAFVDKALNEAKLLSRIRVANGVGRAYVTPAFLSLDHSAKSDFARAFYAWCLDTDPNCGVLVFHEPSNNREIGEVTDFNPTYRAKN